MNPVFQFIDNADAMSRACKRLKGSGWLAVDTEFERISTYYPELCLLQMASPESTVLIDPLAIHDLDPVFDILYDTAIIKVFHSARQDLELFFHLNGKVPTPLFDTQLAAPRLGYNVSMGYANLVRAMLGIELSKSQTRTNWKRRPLRQQQLRYAADDVIYLGEIYQQMIARLSSSDLEDLGKENEALLNPEVYEPDPSMLWVKIKESRRFSGPNLSVLQRLCRWREETARKENRPRKWVLSDRAIIDIARLLPADKETLSGIDGVTKGACRQYGGRLLSLISKARALPPLPFPEQRQTSAS